MLKYSNYQLTQLPCAAELKQPWMTFMDHAWVVAEHLAIEQTQKRIAQGGHKALIAIKAQHPLLPDGTPDAEYRSRLDAALDLYDQLNDENLSVTIMTFGGIHAGHATISLATSGTNYLIKNGIPTDCIIQHPLIFSGNDEDDLASQEFDRDPEYRQLYVCCSAGQWLRCNTYYIAMGWMPAPVLTRPLPGHQDDMCEALGIWGGSFRDLLSRGPAGVREASEEIRQKHLAEAIAFRTDQTANRS